MTTFFIGLACMAGAWAIMGLIQAKLEIRHIYEHLDLIYKILQTQSDHTKLNIEGITELAQNDIDFLKRINDVAFIKNKKEKKVNP